MTATAYPTPRDRLRSLLLNDLLDGDLETDPIAWRYCEYRVTRLMEAADRLGLEDFGVIQTEDDFMDWEEDLDQVEIDRLR